MTEAKKPGVRPHTVLTEVAFLAHAGGRRKLDEHAALVEIRKLTIDVWNGMQRNTQETTNARERQEA